MKQTIKQTSQAKNAQHEHYLSFSQSTSAKLNFKNKLLNQRKNVKSQPCTIEKLDQDIQQKYITFSSHNQPNNRAKPNWETNKNDTTTTNDIAQNP